ncbi:MAG: UDP-N-acetylmuramoyl-tripeptide--D-alanyl-D-alanine ligase [Magnetococcus sp. DMHC-6]
MDKPILSPRWVQAVTQAKGLLPTESMAEKPLSGLSIDSRSVQPNELFVTIAGPKFDGYHFIATALEKGCGAILTNREPEFQVTVPVLIVPNTLTAMNQAALAWRLAVNPKVVAVTGSSGKSTVKQMVAKCLSEKFRVHSTQGNLNNHIGLPLTLLRMPADCQMLVVELGMNAKGEIAHLASLAHPDIGIITNVQPAHMERFASLADIAQAKGELLTALAPDGVGIVPRGSEFFPLFRQLSHCQLLTFGSDIPNDSDHIGAEEIVMQESGSTMVALYQKRRIALNLRQPGQHMVSNALAAFLAVQKAGGSDAECQTGLSSFQPLSGRGEVSTSTHGWQVINDTYNANPGSMTAALNQLGASRPAGRRVAILGDMLELGEHAQRLHQGLAEPIRTNGIQLLFTTGPWMQTLHQELTAPSDPVCQHREHCTDWLGQITPFLQPGDRVLVKGSRGMGMERIVADIIGQKG